MWKHGTIGDVLCLMQNGVNCKQNKSGQGLKITRIETISEAKINYKKTGFASLNDIQKEKAELKKGDILFSHINSSTHVGKTAIYYGEEPLYHGINLLRLKTIEDVDSSYFNYFLCSLFWNGYWKRTAKQSINQASVNQKDIKSVPFSYPILSEQQRIVDKLDVAFNEIDNFISASSHQIINSHNLINLLMNSKIKNLPSSCFKKIGEVCSLVRGPFGGSLKKSIFVEKGFAIYEQSHPINNQCEIFRYFINKDKFDEMRRFEVKPGDILMSCSGTLGKTTIVPSFAPRGIINQALLKLTPSDLILSEYLQIIMKSDFFQKLIWDISGGAAQTNVPAVKVLKNIAIPIPTIREQEIFINWKETLDELNLAKLYQQKRNLFLKLKEAILLNAMRF